MSVRNKELIVYRKLNDEKLFQDMCEFLEQWQEDPDSFRQGRARREQLYGILHGLIDLADSRGFSGNLWHCYLTDLMVNDENSYSFGCEGRGAPEGTLNDAALHDMSILKELFDYDFTPVAVALGTPEFSLAERYVGSGRSSRMYNRRICSRICELAEQFCADRTPGQMKDTLTRFYQEYGVGKFGLHKSFRIVHGETGVQIQPIRNIAHVSLEDLVGYEIPKRKLTENTEAFVAGRKANNCLLYGDAGTGKSTCIKAIANEYYDRGLRIIELYKHQFQDLNEVIAQIKNRNYRFIIYMDDLSFEEFEIEYKYLKAVIEGGLEKKPDNVLIYATSNRRHLIRENYSDREEIREDMHTGDTVQEKLSLVHRFGVTVYFGAPDKKQYQEIVRTLARRNGVTLPEEELLRRANEWELAHGGLSGRSAQQFVDYLAGSGPWE